MAAAAYFDQVQKIYIAFYQRPADPAGLRYWAEQASAAGGDLSQIIDAFAASPEAVELYGAIDTSTVGATIDSLYFTLFGRAPDALGRQFYIDGFAAGTFTPGSIALAVLLGAQGNDLGALYNKLRVANEFTQQADGRPWSNADFGLGSRFDVTYAGDADAVAARDILAGVTVQPGSLLNPAQVTDLLRTRIADPGDAILGGSDSGGGGGSDSGGGGGGGGGPPSDPSSYTLTPGKDTVVGGAGNDTVHGTGATFTSGDSINGGGGTNTLKLTHADSGGLTLPTDVVVQNIQVLSIVNTAGAVMADVRGWEGLQQVTVQQGDATAGTQVETQSNAAHVEVTGGAQAVIWDNGSGVDVGKDTLASVVLRDGGQPGSGSISYIASDALTNLSLVGWGGDAYIAAVPGERTLTLNGLTGNTLYDPQATALQVVAEGAASSDIKLEADNASAIDFGGDAALSLTLGAHADDLTITSNNSAGVTILNQLGNDVTFTGGAGNDTVTVDATTQAIDMGDGDDTVYVTAPLGVGGQLYGGDGDDTLVMTSALAADGSFAGAVQDFETLRIEAVLPSANDSIDMSNLGDAERLVSGGVGAGGSLTVINMANYGTLELTGLLLGSATVQLADAADSEDGLTIKLNGESQLLNTGTLTVAGVEYLTIEAAHSGAASPSAPSALKLDVADAQTIWLSGSHGMDFTGSTFVSGSLKELDASHVVGTGAMGALVLDTSDFTDALMVRTGAGDDRITLGESDDIVLSSTGADVITLGEGRNTYRVVHTDPSSGSAHTVIMDFVVGEDTIQISKALTKKPDYVFATQFNVHVVGTTSEVDDKFSTVAADAFHAVNVVLDSSTYLLYIDANDDGVIDSVIELSGVTSLTDASFSISTF